MEGDPRYEASQDLPDFPYAALRRADRPARHPRRRPRRRSAPRGTQALAADRPVRARGDHRPGGAAAAAAHHARAGEGTSTSALRQGRPHARRDRHASRSSRRSTSSCRADDASHALPGVDTSTAVDVRLHGPDRRARVRRHARAGTRRRSWSSRSQAGGARGHRLHLRRPRGGATSSRRTLAARSSRQPTRWRRSAAWWAMVGAVRNLGRPGIASMAISRGRHRAVGPQGASCSALPLCDAARRGARPRCRSTAAAASAPTPTTGSPSSSAAGSAQGIPRVKMKVGREPGRRPAARRRRARGDRRRRRAVRRRQRRLRAQAGARAGRATVRGALRRALVRGAGLLRRPDGLRAVARPRAGRHGDRGRRVRLRRLPYFARMLDAGAVDCLQADVTRCGGITGLLRVGGALRRRASLAALGALRAGDPRARCAARSRRCATSSTSTTTSRIEQLLFDGALEPDGRGARARTRRGRASGSSSSARTPSSTPHEREPCRTRCRAQRCADAAALQTTARGATAAERRCRSASRSTSSTTRARSATSGCGRRSCCTPPLAAAGVAGVVLRARGAHRAARGLGALLRSTGSSASSLHVRGVQRKPGGFRRADLQPRDGAAAAGARARSRWSARSACCAAIVRRER